MSSILVYSVDLRLELREKLINVVLSFYPKCRAGGGGEGGNASLWRSLNFIRALAAYPFKPPPSPPSLYSLYHTSSLLLYYSLSLFIIHVFRAFFSCSYYIISLS
jgi:hypothetical protein